MLKLVLKVWDTQGYLWLCYDLAEVINLIAVTLNKKIFFSKKYLALLSFPNVLLYNIYGIWFPQNLSDKKM
jgi:hypothetical protein